LCFYYTSHLRTCQERRSAKSRTRKTGCGDYIVVCCMNGFAVLRFLCFLPFLMGLLHFFQYFRMTFFKLLDVRFI